MKQIIKLSFVAAAMLTLGGCKKFIDVNQNTNSLVTAPAEQIMSGALAGTYDVQVSTNVHIIPGSFAGHYAHSTSFTGGGAEKTYEYTAANFNAFTGLYDNLNDYQRVKAGATAKTSYLNEQADVMQCYVYQMLVDLYGNVPYTEALKGSNNVTPKYDNAQTIYEDLVKRLDSSMARMARATWPTDANLLRQDIMFGMDKDRWIRFANTVKLRILMRQVYMPGRAAYITGEISNSIARGYLESNAQIEPGYSNQAGKLNTFYGSYGYDEVGNVLSNYNYRKMNAVIVNWLKTSITTGPPPTRPSTTNPNANSSADTFRLQRLIAPKAGTAGAPNDYAGVPYGSVSGFTTATSSSIGPFAVNFGEADHPGYIMLAAESYFLQAEASQWFPALNFNGMTGQQLYEAGITAHFRVLADPYSDASTSNIGDQYASWYYNRTANPTRLENVTWAGSSNKKRAIQIQKWVSLVHISGLEAWSEYRKTNGTPDVSVPQSPATTDPSVTNPEPARYLIPQVELNTNSANAPRNDRFAKLFWDVN